MHEDDVDSDEFATLPDGLDRHVSDVRHELQREVVGLLAAGARAEVLRDVLPLEMERAMHGDGGLQDPGDSGRPGQRASALRERKAASPSISISS